MSLDSISTSKTLTLLDDMIVHQRQKCLKIAHRINPRLTPDDLMNPFDWPEVSNQPEFCWEDGLLAGLQAAHAAIAGTFVRDDAHYEVRRVASEPLPDNSSPSDPNY